MISFLPRLQRLLSSQNRRIDQLVDKIKQQQDKLEKQSVHLNALQRKVSRKLTEARKTNPATCWWFDTRSVSHQVAHKRVKSHRRRDEETVLRGEPANSQQASGEEQHTVGKW